MYSHIIIVANNKSNHITPVYISEIILVMTYSYD